MSSIKNSLLLYAVTDRKWTEKETLYQQVRQCLEGGVTCLQLREKDIDSDMFLEEAISIGKLCNKFNIPFIVNDDVTIAIQSGADGVHIGQHDADAGEVRSIIGSSMIMGVSVQNVPQAIKAEADGADYLGVGAIFATSTKSDADGVSISTLKDICSAVSVPIVAIGGITEDNIHLLKQSGIDGVAVVSAIFARDNIKNATKQLLEKAKECVGI